MINKDFRKKVSNFILENENNFIKDITTLVEIKSIQGKATDDAPYGKEVKDALIKALEIAENLGLNAVNCENHIGYAEVCGDSNKYLASIGHLDVVPEGNGWKGDPFIVRNIEGWLVARGVADNKGACVLSMYMLKFFKENYDSIPYSLRAIFGCNEETGMLDVKHYLNTQPEPEFCFTPDANFPVCIGEKGIASYNLISPIITNTNIISFSAGSASNVIPDRAVLVVKSNDELIECENIKIEKDNDIYTITAFGIGGHAAMPKGTVNAIKIILDYAFLNNLFSKEEIPYMSLLVKLHSNTDGSGVKIDANDGLFDPLTCVGGIINLKNGKYTQNINVRYPTNTSYEKINETLSEQFSAIGGEVPLSKGKAPFYISPENPVVKALVSTYNEVSGDNAEPYLIGGGTYARSFSFAVAFGMEFENEIKPSFIGGVHEAEEGQSIASLKKALEIMIIAMDELLKLEY